LDEGSGYLIYVGTVPDLTFNAPITFDPRYLTQGPFYNGEPRDDFTQATQGGGAFIQITGGVPLGAQLIYSDGQTSYLPGDFAGSYKELVTGGLIDYSHAGSVIYLPAAYSGEGGLFTAYQTDQSIRSFDSGVAGLVNGFLVLGAGVTVPGLGGDLAPSGMGAGPESAAIDVTARLTQHLNDAIDTFNAQGFTDAQADALINNPGLEAAFRGSQIDSIFKGSVAADPDLTYLELTPRFKFGPDVFDPETQQWWDDP
jgi:hypothetical protein